MFGFSIFMNDSLSEEKKQYIRQMASNGFVGIFTSMHIPEDDVSAYQKRLIELGSEAKKNKLELMVDISGEALAKAGFSYKELNELTDRGAFESNWCNRFKNGLSYFQSADCRLVTSIENQFEC